MSRGTILALTDLVTSAEGAGYSLPAELTDAYDTFVAVKTLKIPAPQALDVETAAARIVNATAAGKPADLMALAAEVAEIELGKQRHDQARHIMTLAIEQAGDKATFLCADLTEKIISEHLWPALKALYAQAREVAAALDGYDIANPHALVTAPAKVRNAYGQLPELVARKTAIFTARYRVNSIGYRVAKHDDMGLYAEFRSPLSLYPNLRAPTSAPGPIPAPEDPAARLLWVVGPKAEAGHPWLPTVAERDAAWLEQFGPDARAKAARAKALA